MTKKTQKKKRLTRRQLARREKEVRAQRLITWIAIGVGTLVIAILAYGLITEVIIAARAPVAQIGERTLRANEFKARQSYERWMAQLQIYQYQTYLDQINQSEGLNETGTPVPGGEEGESATPSPSISDDPLAQQIQFTISNLERQLSPDLASTFAENVLDSMIEEELIRQAAETRDLSVTEDEIQLRIEREVGYDRDAITQTQTLTDTAIAGGQPQFDEIYKQFETNVLEITRYPEDDFRAMIRANVLREKLKDALAEDIETSVDQVETTVFIANDEAQAEALRARMVEAGEDPEVLVDELSGDENDETTGYALPWLPEGYIGNQLGAEIEQAAFNTPVGSASEPVLSTDDRYYVVYVSGHEVRELSPDLLEQEQEDAYQSWLTEQKEEKVEYLNWEEAVVTE
jgi:parvulin-like peptidyl-prolyl isomerase